MPVPISRRTLLRLAAVAGAWPLAKAQEMVNNQRPTVALLKGDVRRKLAFDALMAIDDQIRPALKRKKYVVIKPNNVSTVNQLAATHADALHGILDYLDRVRFKGPVVISESSAGETMEGFETFHYDRVAQERRRQRVSLVDLNAEAKYKAISLIDFDLHAIPVRLAARLMDPDAFIICSAAVKTHNVVVATLSVKNMCLGAPLHQAPKETPKWNDKRKYHNGIRQMHYNIFRTAQALRPFWGATLIDGYEGQEGNGPSAGTPVPQRIAIASTDYIAADRIGVECMGVDPEWLGYLQFCSLFGLGQYDSKKIELRGEKVAAVQRKYRLHRDVDRQLQWMGPLQELPPNLG
jgi:uncharacterized protein (DUF362 family)